MKNVKSVLGLSLMAGAFALAGCNNKTAQESNLTPQEQQLDLRAPSGEQIATDVAELKELMVPHVEATQQEHKDFVIDEIRYQPWEKGYMAEVIYTTNDGASSNVVFVQQPAGQKVTSGDETSGESGKASYSCMPNESETCSGGRLAISPEGDLSCVCDKGQTEGCSLHEIKY